MIHFRRAYPTDLLFTVYNECFKSNIKARFNIDKQNLSWSIKIPGQIFNCTLISKKILIG